MPRHIPEWVGKHDDQMPGTLVRDRISRRQGDKCKCGKPFGPTIRANCDHVIPIADGGENRESNLQMLCNHCHVEKTSAEAAARRKSRSVRAKHLGLDKITGKAPGRGSLPGKRIKYSRARGVYVDRFTGEIVDTEDSNP